MAKSAISELQQQIEEVRREAFAAGYASAMQAVRERASRPAPGDGASVSRAPGAARRAAGPTRRPPGGASQGARPRRPTAQRPQRGGRSEERRVGKESRSR